MLAADVTVTFGAIKSGLVRGRARNSPGGCTWSTWDSSRTCGGRTPVTAPIEVVRVDSPGSLAEA